MKAAKEENKNFFELAKKKGYSEQQVKEMMIKNKFEHIDAAVEKGKITKEQAGEIKSKLKEKISNWDGSFKKHEDIKREDSKKEDKQ
jgi:ribosomal protein S20